MSDLILNTRIPTTFGLEPRYVRERRDPSRRGSAIMEPVAKPPVEEDREAEKLACMDQLTPTLRQRVMDVARQPKYISVAVALPVLSAMAAWTLAHLSQVAHDAGVLLGVN